MATRQNVQGRSTIPGLCKLESDVLQSHEVGIDGLGAVVCAARTGGSPANQWAVAQP
jgi:hypothetical protein